MKMPFAAALSTQPRTEQALDEVCARTAEGAATAPDLAVVFFSPHHLGSVETIVSVVQERLRPRVLVGCVGEAVIGNDQEIEGNPALSLWLAGWNPDGRRAVEVEPFHLVLERTSEGFSLLGWPDGLVGADPATAAMLVLGDPHSFPADFFLGQVNEDYRGLRVIGGMASGVGRDQVRLLGGGTVYDGGAVGVLLQGPIGLRSVVSQGCRPIGRHMVVTRAAEDIIFELGGQPPLVVLQELWEELSPRDRELFQQGLHVGRVINEAQGEFRRGDFLVRNVRHLDRQTGALVIMDRVRVGQTVQFHVRDAETADEDLHALMRQSLAAGAGDTAGALIFSCNGRGTRLFDQPHHDARVVRNEAGPVPVAGFFAAGELGPIGGQNFIHGFTASVALFAD
jgi:small ligand-binding sensory domain FIST